MANDLDPLIEQWYWHQDKGQRFYVTGIDDHSRTVEVQHFDGDVEEYTLSEWRELDIGISEPPENWHGAMDVESTDDPGPEVTQVSDEGWPDPSREVGGLDNERNAPAAGGNKDDYGEGYMEEESLEDGDRQMRASDKIDANVTRRPDGVFEETFSDSWYAEYSEDPDSGLWRVDVYNEDVASWRNTDFESMEEAMLAAREYYSQV